MTCAIFGIFCQKDTENNVLAPRNVRLKLTPFLSIVNAPTPSTENYTF